jgi:nucleotide-binding universal stress UspA family protein
MYKHILLPTDGSKLSAKAVRQAVRFAQSIGAKLTAIHVSAEYRAMMDEGFAVPASRATARQSSATGPTTPSSSRRKKPNAI